MTSLEFNSKKKDKFLDLLAYKMPPFDRFVAKGDIEEWDDILSSREDVLYKISALINETKHSLLIPIIGSMGIGKTHALWGIKNSFNIEAFTTFVTLPRSKNKFHYYFYSDLIDNFGADNLKEFTMEFGDKFGANEKLYGMFKTQNTSKIIKNSFEELKYLFEEESDLEQCITVIIEHLMSPEKFTIAERWLLGQLMDYDELFIMNIDEDLSGKDMAYTMLKLLIENYSKGILILFDDLSKKIKEFEGIHDFEEDDDFDWAEENNENMEKNDVEKSLQQIIIDLLLNINNFKIIICLEEGEDEKILNFFQRKLEFNKEILAEPMKLDIITLEDMIELYFTRIQKFSIDNNFFSHPVADRNFDPKRNFEEYYQKFGEDLFFPLNRKIMGDIHDASKGNIRTCLKNFKKILDALIFEETTPEKLKSGYSSYITV